MEVQNSDQDNDGDENASYDLEGIIYHLLMLLTTQMSKKPHSNNQVFRQEVVGRQLRSLEDGKQKEVGHFLVKGILHSFIHLINIERCLLVLGN